MRKMRIVEGFYDVKKIGKVKRDEVKNLKEMGIRKPEARIEDAHAFYLKYPDLRYKLAGRRRPVPGDMMVVIFYDEVKDVVKKVVRKVSKVVKEVVETIVNEVIEKVDEKKEGAKKLRSLFAPCLPKRTEKRKAVAFSTKGIFEAALSAFAKLADNTMSIPLGDVRKSFALAA